MASPRRFSEVRTAGASRPYQKHIFIKVPHDLFKFTTADENVVIVGMWEPFSERRPSGQDYRRPEGGSHIQGRIFMKVPHDLFKFTTADENGGPGGQE